MTDPVATLRRTAGLVVILTLFTAPIAAAQTPSPGLSAQTIVLSGTTFAKLISGKQLIVTTTDGLEYVGVFAVEGNAIVANGPKLAMTIPFGQIARVQKDSFRMRHHALIGLVAGSVFGAVIPFASCHDCGDDGAWLFSAAAFAGIGAAIGIGVGAMLNASQRDKDIIYDARRYSMAMSIGPILSPTRKGVAFTMTWR